LGIKTHPYQQNFSSIGLPAEAVVLGFDLSHGGAGAIVKFELKDENLFIADENGIDAAVASAPFGGGKGA
jgi:hypothetical protein